MSLRYLTPSASVNGIPVVDIPGMRVDDGIRGKLSGDLVSSRVLHRLIRESGTVLQLPEELTDNLSGAAVYLDGCFVSSDEVVHQAAEAIARRIGRNLGYALLVLRRADDVNRRARLDWDDAWWHHWQTVPVIWLGGGLIRGRLRDYLPEAIMQVFQEGNTPVPDIRLDTHGPWLPLAGAARCVPPGYQHALIFDCGGTAIKCACAHYDEDGTLTGLTPLLIEPRPQIAITTLDDPAQLQVFLDMLLDVFARAMGRLPVSPEMLAPVIPVSMAAYIARSGIPLPRERGLYAALRLIEPDLLTAMRAGFFERTGQRRQFRLIHDGTAAATLHNEGFTITLGTALGVGMASACDDLRPVRLPLMITTDTMPDSQ